MVIRVFTLLVIAVLCAGCAPSEPTQPAGVVTDKSGKALDPSQLEGVRAAPGGMDGGGPPPGGGKKRPGR